MVPDRTASPLVRPSATTLASECALVYGGAMRGTTGQVRTARTARIAAGVVLAVVAVIGPTQRAVAITWSQAEVAVAVPSDAPHDGLAGGVVDADTAGSQPAATGPSPVLLLIAALGILIGVLIVTRSRRGPDG